MCLRLENNWCLDKQATRETNKSGHNYVPIIQYVLTIHKCEINIDIIFDLYINKKLEYV